MYSKNFNYEKVKILSQISLGSSYRMQFPERTDPEHNTIRIKRQSNQFLVLRFCSAFNAQNLHYLLSKCSRKLTKHDYNYFISIWYLNISKTNSKTIRYLIQFLNTMRLFTRQQRTINDNNLTRKFGQSRKTLKSSIQERGN